MLDIITATANKRNELLTYIKANVREESYVWARNLLSDMTKKVITMKDDEFTIRVYPFYKNVKFFFTDICTELSPGCILLTLYICAIELGIRTVGDSVEKLKEFTDEIDMNDWDTVDVSTAIDFDLRASTILTQKYFGMEDTGELYACGLNTLNLIDFVISKQE